MSAGDMRTEAVAAALRARSLQALIVTYPANVRYLTGYTGSNGLALIFADAHARARFFTDFRYRTQAAEEVGAAAPACQVDVVTGDLLLAAATLLREESPSAHGEGAALSQAQDASPPAPDTSAARSQGSPSTVGFEDDQLTVAAHRRLATELQGACQLAACSGVVQALRAVKDRDEQRMIAAAAQLADQALREVLEEGLIGKTERQLAIELESRMRRLGAEAPSFSTIVAAGAGGALPHAQPRDVKLAAGEPSDRAREIYDLVLRAQRAGVAALAPSRTGREVDALAREIIEQAGYGEHFGHGLGHGVGLEIHEGPRLSKTAPEEETLRAGSVVTVEPGVYLPGELGVRIEDLLLVTDDGARSLSELPRELTVLD